MEKKTYTLILSERFPAWHSKSGRPTNFRDSFISRKKLHTIRSNFALWEKRIKEVREGTPYYIGRSSSTRFTWQETEERSRSAVTGHIPAQEDVLNGGMIPESPTDKMSVRVDKCDVTSCVVFDYDALYSSVEVDLAREVFYEEKEEVF